ncbi:chemotaxis protein CheW [Aquincola sp. S2]|uniref:Chemotaxis protein CheW n=1 Tax=Pseudaquabacterium terrae TaxID=2732868 RepID=A0ABX2EHL9_9BURK|nr:chemotaxis protein CheW [Aquabacterium terrae]NRF68121.1 chemotaxis protein CheW [Aquabacterium terrae]
MDTPVVYGVGMQDLPRPAPAPGAHAAVLVFEAGGWRCALPLACLRETMRALPIEALADAPAGVLGLAVIRGEPVPVVDVAALLGAAGALAGRLITISVAERPVALAVDGVLGVRSMPHAALHALPPLLHEAGSRTIDAIAALDGALLLLLGQARLLPEAAHARVDAARADAAVPLADAARADAGAAA